MSHKGHRLVDLDGTLAEYGEWQGPSFIGAPIPKMVERVQRWLDKGDTVKIFTARVYPLGIHPDYTPFVREGEYEAKCAEATLAHDAIEDWCFKYIGQYLDVICWKDFSAWCIFDDRAVQVERNTGRIIHGDLD